MLETAPDGILLVDKPQGISSHRVVSIARRRLGLKKVGHAGTLDPMATGLLLLGIGPSTRLLTHLVGLDKTYTATIRLGVSTDSDDADGTPTAAVGVGTADVSDDAVETAVAAQRGVIDQVPSTVSAIKVDGRRAYDLVRAGEEVELKARRVTVSRFDVRDTRREGDTVALDVVVDCTSGTYIRALARDLGRALGVGGHLTALRRTRIGAFDVDTAASVDDLAEAALISPAVAADQVVGSLSVSADEARDLRHGKRIDGGARLTAPFAAAIAPDGTLIGVVERRGAQLKSVMNMPEEVVR